MPLHLSTLIRHNFSRFGHSLQCFMEAGRHPIKSNCRNIGKHHPRLPAPHPSPSQEGYCQLSKTQAPCRDRLEVPQQEPLDTALSQGTTFRPSQRRTDIQASLDLEVDSCTTRRMSRLYPLNISVQAKSFLCL